MSNKKEIPNSFKIEGIITKIEDTEIISATFSKRVVFIQTVEEYKQTLKLEFHNGQIMQLNQFTEGMQCNFLFNIRGKTWTNKDLKEQHFTTLRCYSIF